MKIDVTTNKCQNCTEVEVIQGTLQAVVLLTDTLGIKCQVDIKARQSRTVKNV